MEKNESGFVAGEAVDSGIAAGLTDVEIITVTGTNIIARGKRFGRLWLLKGIIPELRESPSARRRLQKEFEIHSRLLHPDIVRVASLEDIPSLGICIVEEWVEGETLAALLRKGSLSKRERRRILREIVAAAGYLHSQGVVHRDLKPQNIMVRREGGEIVLIDFGLADTGDYAELKQGAGSKGYISPEQITEGGARITDDIYSLGVIMREICPEYTRIANRCTGPLEKRPKDTSALSRMLDRTDRRPRLVAWGVAAVLSVAVAAAVSLHVRSVSAETKEVKVQIDTLTDSNAKNAARVAELEQLLYKATGRLMTAEAVISSANDDRGVRRRAMIDTYRKLENEYIRFEQEEVPQFTEKEGKLFTDRMQTLRDRCDSIVRETYNLKRFPELADADSTVVIGEMRSVAEQLYSVYFSTWHAKLAGRWLKDHYNF